MRALSLRYGLSRESEEVRRLLRYSALLEKWNSRINLTASTEWPAVSWLYEEALWAAQWYPQTEVVHLDLGSGAGFPALLLKILGPGMRLRLVESRAKRAAFLETVAADLHLDGTDVVAGRVEEYLRGPAVPEFDIVSWKGLKLSRRAFRLLLAASRPTTQVWLFHGPELPLEDPAHAQDVLTLRQREPFPGRPDRWLSIFGQ